jgi:hypothetical protein
MAEFTANPKRFDPYKNFKFRVKWDGRYVAGVSKVSALKRTTEVVEFREGGDPSTSRRSPGRNKYEAITIERGVTHDAEFEKWAAKVWQLYKLYRCWVSEYQALPDLDANANAVAIQHIKIELEGWDRDVSTSEPTEPVFDSTHA